MKTQNRFFNQALLLLSILLVLSCSNEGDDETAIIEPPETNYSVSDLDVTIEENPVEGSILGTLSTDLPGTLTYTSDNAAIGFDVESLEVNVVDMAAFDYELNTSVTGTITISNGDKSVSASITITLTDLIDGIEALLTTSKEAYQQAAQGDWVEVTLSEFEALESQLEEVAYSGTSQEDYTFSNSSTGISLGSNDTVGYTLANVSDATLGERSYLFALRFFVGTGIFGVSGGNKVKISETNASEGYSNIGNPLPEKTSTEREVFYVLKLNVTPTANTAHLALYFAPANGGTRKDSSGFTNFQAGDLTEFINVPAQGSTFAYQGLSTTKLQWD